MRSLGHQTSQPYAACHRTNCDLSGGGEHAPQLSRSEAPAYAVDREAWRAPSQDAAELRSALCKELEMTALRDGGGRRLLAIHNGRLTGTYRKWFHGN